MGEHSIIGQHLESLVSIIRSLRGPDGCPWDKAATTESMRPYLLEEVYEVLEALDDEVHQNQADELGDLLFTVLLLGQILDERVPGSLASMVSGISEKMIRRHPHVFDPEHISSDDEGSVMAWEARKAKERARLGTSALDGVPDALPGLLRAHRITEKASRVGFDWPNVDGVLAKVEEETIELREAIVANANKEIAEEYGDLIFSVVNLGRFLPVDAETALRCATNKFSRRFRLVERNLALKSKTIYDTPLDELEFAWNQVKQLEQD
jgi:tetrapyrrole methylase family protein/MazG family protein